MTNIFNTFKTIHGKFMKYSPKYNVWGNREGTYATVNIMALI